MSEIAYRTLLKEGSDEFIVQKSRFIGYAAPVAEQEAALNYISHIKQNHRDASHHCYAYVIGSNSGNMRYQDDGEPTGTAGQPIMEVIKLKGLVNICVVVVRYFGGTLLGTGGLVRAYSHGANLAVAAAGIVMMEPSSKLFLAVPYTIWDKLQHHLLNLPVYLDEVIYTQQVEVNLIARACDMENVEKAVADISDGRAQCAQKGKLYYAWPSA